MIRNARKLATVTTVETPKTRLEIMTNMLETLAYHTAAIRTDPAHMMIGCGISNGKRTIVCKITITPAHGNPRESTDVWDQVTINGVACGNRCGGANEYARIMAPLFAELCCDE